MQGKVAVEIDESRLEWWGRGVGHRGTFTSWAIVIVEEKGGKNKTMKEKWEEKGNRKGRKQATRGEE